MYGFPKRSDRPQAQNIANGGEARGFIPEHERQKSGLVRGPGTGTSDSVKTAVPEGTYIMPADSVAQIGEQNIAAMGFRPGMRQPPAASPGFGFRPGSKPPAPNAPGLGFGQTSQIPVNLSNGEFRLSPEQVHAIGVQVLEGMKAATHEPAGPGEKYEQRGSGGGNDASRPDLFFADGGLVESQNKRGPFDYQAPGSTPPRPGPAPIPGAERNDLAVRAPAGASSGQAKPASPIESPVKGPLDSLGSAYGATANKLSFGAFDSRGDEIRQQNRAGLIAQPDQPAAPRPSPQAQSLTTNPGLTPAPATPPNSGPVPYTVTPVENTNGVQRINQPGKSPLFTNIEPGQAVAEMKGNPVGGFRPASMRGDAAGPAPSGPGLGFGPGSVGEQQRMSGVGGPDVMGILQRENQIRAGMGELQDQINFNGGNGIGFRKTTNDEIVRDMLVNGNSRDRASALGFMAGGRDAAAKQGLDQQEMALRQQQQNVATADFGLRREAAGFQSASQRQIQALQQQYVSEADPARKAEIERSIRLLSGQMAPKAPFQIATAEEPVDPARPGLGMRKTPYVVDPATGQGRPVVQPKAATSAPPMPADKAQRKAGTIYTLADGRRVKWDGTGAIEVN